MILNPKYQQLWHNLLKINKIFFFYTISKIPKAPLTYNLETELYFSYPAISHNYNLTVLPLKLVTFVVKSQPTVGGEFASNL